MDRQAAIQQRIDRERITGPEWISSTPEVRRGGSVRRAFCKTDAGTGSTIQAYLDNDDAGGTQTPGEEVTVNCDIISASEETDLSNCVPHLSDGDPMPVYRSNGQWYCYWWFCGDLDCESV